MVGEASQFAARDGLKTASVTIFGQTLVGGLHWEPLNVVRSLNTAVRDRSKRQGFTSACIWSNGTTRQVGYGVQARGATAGALSLAALIAKGYGKDGLVAVNVGDEKYALVAVQDGLVQSGIDFIGTREWIAERFVYEMQELAKFKHDYKNLAAPPEIYDGVEVLTAEQLLQDVLEQADRNKRTDAEGRIFSTAKKVATAKESKARRLIGVVFVAAIICVGVLYYGHVQRVEIAAKVAADAKRRWKEAQEHKVPPPPPKPWISEPSVQDTLDSCSVQLSKLPLDVGGWMIYSARCGQGVLQAKYQRMGNATVADLLSAFGATLHVQPKIDTDGNNATLDVRFIPPQPSSENLIPEDDAVTAFLSHFQSLEVKPQFKLRPPPSPPAGKTAKDMPPPPPWKTYDFTIDATPLTAINTEHYPSLLLGGLEIPGLRVTAIALTRLDDAPYLTWTVQGEMYAQ